MKSFFRNLSSRFPFFANRPSALERAVRQSPKSRRLRMEPLENRALLAVDAFGGAASLLDSDVGESWGPDPAPAAFSASELATDAAVIDLTSVDATLAETTFSVQNETPEPVAPPSFEQLMESLGMIEIESLDDESDVASSSFLDAIESTQSAGTQGIDDVEQAEARHVVFYDSSAADFDASTLNPDDESVYYVDAANANAGDAESYSATPRSGGSGGSSDCQFTTYGSTTIFESATYNSSGGSNQGPFLGFTVPAIPSGYAAFVRFEGTGAIYGHDYYVMTANIVDGVATPQHSLYYSNPSQSNYDLYVSGGTSYCVIPINDSEFEQPETLAATFYLVDTNSGGADYDPTPVACDSFTATIIDDDATFSVYWRDNSSASGAPLSGNPNGGGARFFPEQTDPNASSLKNKVDLVFKLNAPSDENVTIYYRLLDPDNNISLGYDQPADASFIGGDNNNQNGFDELSYGQEARSLVIPAGTTEYALTLTLSDAYAGDNFIVVAGRDASTVAVAELGTTATTRYEVVQPTNATDETKLRQTQNLTVWRTLWVECDRMIFNNSYAGETPVINEFVRYPFLTACIDVQTYGNNVDLDFIGSEYVDRTAQFAESEEFTESRSLPTPTKEYWTLRLISAFSWLPEDSSEQGALGVFFAGFNTAFIFDKSLNEQIDAYNNGKSGENLLGDLDKELIRSQVTLHEMGHAFGLPDIARPQGQENTSYGVMTQEVGLFERLDFDYFTFTNPNIWEMQKRVCPY